MYIGFVYGVDSHELAAALYRDREFHPMDRFSSNAHGRQAFQAYLSCLRRWNCVYWKAVARATDPIEWKAEAEHLKSDATPLTQERTKRALRKRAISGRKPHPFSPEGDLRSVGVALWEISHGSTKYSVDFFKRFQRPLVPIKASELI
jgi:hypothetical protein